MIQRGMDGENIRFFQQCIKIYLMIPLLGRSSGSRIIDYPGAEHTGNIRHSPAYSPKSQDSPGHSLKFVESLAEMGENTVIHIMAFFHIVIIVTKPFQKIEQQGKSVLGHRFCGVSGYIPPLDTPKSQVIFI